MAKQNTSITKRRKESTGLIVCKEAATVGRLRQALNSLGYMQLSSANSHVQGLERLKGRRFSIVFFDALPTNMPTKDFVAAAKKLDEETQLIALSAQPQIDDVFELLRAGARSYLVLPFTTDTLEEVIIKAVDGPPFSEAVLEATDRDAALAGLVLNNLYRVTSAMRYLRTYPGAINDLENYRNALEESVDMAHTFSKNGDLALRNKICDACMLRAETASTRLGRTRQRLRIKRVKDKLMPTLQLKKTT